MSTDTLPPQPGEVVKCRWTVTAPEGFAFSVPAKARSVRGSYVGTATVAGAVMHVIDTGDGGRQIVPLDGEVIPLNRKKARRRRKAKGGGVVKASNPTTKEAHRE